MEHYAWIIIGNGSTALNFLYAAYKGDKKLLVKPGKNDKKKILILGEDDLWTRFQTILILR